MSRSALVTCQIVLTAATVAAQTHDDRPERRVDDELQKQINDAVRTGAHFVLESQQADGRWRYDNRQHPAPDGSGKNDHDAGLTALALYAAATSGVPASHPAIERGLAWIDEHPGPFARDASKATYCCSLLVLALTRIDAEAHRAAIHRAARALVKGQRRDGMWSYRLTTATPADATIRGDNSNTQFAVLALWSAWQLGGYRVPRKVWKRVAAMYERTQRDSGGWSYHGAGDEVDLRMTAAGLVSYVYATAALDGGIEHLADARRTPVAAKALAHFLAERDDWNLDSHYFIYSVERVGTVVGVPDFVWYRDGAAHLVGRQSNDGRWKPQGFHFGHGDTEHVYGTSLALLFLNKASITPITPRPERNRAK